VSLRQRSTALDQDLEKNKADILHLANEKNLGKVEFVQEKVSGKVSWRNRKIGPILDELKKGDVILLSEFSRLGRSMLEVMEIISIAMQKGIRIYTVKGAWQLDDSIQSKVMAMVFAMASEIDRIGEPKRPDQQADKRVTRGQETIRGKAR
jgi:DNA invertase Pin-like site-specific DNA recombinase